MKKDDKPPGGGNNLSLPQKVSIVYSDVKREYFPTEEQYITEKEAYKEAKIVSRYLNRLEVETFLYPATLELSNRIKRTKPDMVFNLTGSILGQEYLIAAVPGILEMHDVPYTGAGILGMSLDHNKFLVKKLLQQHGVPVPNFQLFTTYTTSLNNDMRYPLISKLNEIHGAVELNDDAISTNEKHLKDRVKFLINTYKQPVLVEEFIVGKEVSAVLLEGLNKKVYLAERLIKDAENPFAFATFDMQWEGEDDAITYEKYLDSVLSELIKKAFDTVRMADYGKFDIRIDASGRYYFIDSNCNPAFGPKEAECPMSFILDLYGVSFNKILKRLMINTMRDAINKPLLSLP